MKDDIVCYSDEVGFTAENEVMFKICKDSKGLGVCEVMNVDGTPIEYCPLEQGDGGCNDKRVSPELGKT